MNPISIYIVEDELLISASLKSQLEQFGYEISGSSIRGEVCLEEVEALSKQGREPEIVLMDIHLRGDLDGIETAKLLNEKFSCAIIFLTGQSSKEIYERSFRIKPFGYLLKPIDMEQTKMTIEIASYQRNLEIQNTLYRKDLEALLEKRSQENKELMVMYQTLVDNSLLGLSIMQEGKIIYANNQTANIFGYSLEEFMKLTTRDVLNMTHPEDRDKVFTESGSSPRPLGSNEAIVARVRMFSREKQLKHIETHIKSMNYKGKPAFHHIFIDITSFLST